MGALFAAVALAQRELLLFCAVLFTLGALDDLAVDLLWLSRRAWRRVTVYRFRRPMRVADLPAPERPGRLALFVAAWAEAGVIGSMLATTARRWAAADVLIFVGCYPNDSETIAEAQAAAELDPRIQVVVHDRSGPSTKACCLNRLWRALMEEERASGPVKAVALHDAEDLVHRDEPRLFDLLIERKALVQLPVVPLTEPGSRWIGGHYADEFAEAHTKQLVLREAIGAGLPSAGVGCAIDRQMLGRVAEVRGGMPFDASSLTEDYELGLSLRDLGGSAMLARVRDADGELVATRAHFPATLDAAVRQKSRWLAGIALIGWDRLGWSGGWRELWMRLHDRRAPLSALVLAAAYLALVLTLLLWAGEALGWGRMAPLAPWLALLLMLNVGLLAWRLFMRAVFVGRLYGWRDALRAVPRVLISNVIAIVAARRALVIYLRHLAGSPPQWDKTRHAFPRAIHG